MKRNAEADKYIASQPAERQKALEDLREVICGALPEGFEEMMQSGMINYVVPLSIYPPGYHVKPGGPLPFMALANQKQYIALYHMGIYQDSALMEWFRKAYEEKGIGRLDMGKSCIRFKKPDRIPLDLVRELCGKMPPARYIALYEQSRNKAQP